MNTRAKLILQFPWNRIMLAIARYRRERLARADKKRLGDAFGYLWSKEFDSSQREASMQYYKTYYGSYQHFRDQV